MSGTRFPSPIQVGTTILLSLATGVVGYFAGTVQLEKVAFVNNPAVITVTGTTVLSRNSIVCTSGSCSITNPFAAQSMSGVVTLACLSMNRTPGSATAPTWDVGFSSTPKSTSGTQLINSQAVGSGDTVCAAVGNFSGSSVWPGGSSIVAAVSGDSNTVSGSLLFEVVPNPVEK